MLRGNRQAPRCDIGCCCAVTSQASHQQDQVKEMRRPVEQLQESLPRTDFHVVPPKILIPPDQPINSLTNSRKEQRTAGSLERDRGSSDQNVIVFSLYFVIKPRQVQQGHELYIYDAGYAKSRVCNRTCCLMSLLPDVKLQHCESSQTDRDPVSYTHLTLPTIYSV